MLRSVLAFVSRDYEDARITLVSISECGNNFCPRNLLTVVILLAAINYRWPAARGFGVRDHSILPMQLVVDAGDRRALLKG